MLSCVPAMIHAEGEGGSNKKKPLTFLSNIFKRKKEQEDTSTDTEATFEEASPDNGNGNCKGFEEGLGGQTSCNLGRVPSSLSVVEYMGIVVHPCSVASTLTLTPGRTRNLDRDMEALRLSRQDNPFLQVLASRESLIDCGEDNVSDAAILMSHEQCGGLEQDPLTLPEVHEHMIRSPPPTTWPRSPNSRVFRFPSPSAGPGSDYDDSSQESLVGGRARSKSPLRSRHSHPSPKRSRSVIEGAVLSPGERSPEHGSSLGGGRMSGRLSLTPKAPRRCSSDLKGCGSSGFSLLQAPKRIHRDEEELLVGAERPPGAELTPRMLSLSPPRMS